MSFVIIIILLLCILMLIAVVAEEDRKQKIIDQNARKKLQETGQSVSSSLNGGLKMSNFLRRHCSANIYRGGVKSCPCVNGEQAEVSANQEKEESEKLNRQELVFAIICVVFILILYVLFLWFNQASFILKDFAEARRQDNDITFSEKS